MPRRPRLKPIFQQVRIPSTDTVIRQPKRHAVLTPRRGFTPINNIRPWLAARILQCLGNNKRKSLRQDEAQEPAVELPQSILPPVRPRELPLSCRLHGLVMREQPVDEQCVDGDYDERRAAGARDGGSDRDPLGVGVGVLQGDVV